MKHRLRNFECRSHLGLGRFNRLNRLALSRVGLVRLLNVLFSGSTLDVYCSSSIDLNLPLGSMGMIHRLL